MAQRLVLPAAVLIQLLSFAPAAVATEAKFDSETGYRISRYRAPVPESVPEATRVDIAEVERLAADPSVVMLDVMASTGPGADFKTGTWRIAKPRQHIPGSVWLPDVGKGKLDPRLDTYFRTNLARLTEGDKSRPIVIYCQSDCWMSWNAVKRAAKYGYTNIFWYPEGTDGWQDWNGNLVPATPVPLSVN